MVLVVLQEDHIVLPDQRATVTQSSIIKVNSGIVWYCFILVAAAAATAAVILRCAEEKIANDLWRPKECVDSEHRLLGSRIDPRRRRAGII